MGFKNYIWCLLAVFDKEADIVGMLGLVYHQRTPHNCFARGIWLAKPTVQHALLAEAHHCHRRDYICGAFPRHELAVNTK